jgi:Ser/Thr protein kinase RdoA (MazF antagonist)
LDDLQYFKGGREESDGVIYTYPYQNSLRLLKVMAMPRDAQGTALFVLDERLNFAHFLGDHGARIAHPQRSPQDRLYETISHGQHLWVAYTMNVAPGRVMSPQTFDPDFFRAWGQTIGLLHRLARQYPSWQGSVDPETGGRLLTWRREWEGFYDWCQDDEVRGQWAAIKDELEALPVTRDAFGFIHNDPHLWNLLVDGARITLLDFDVANHHWFLTDVAIACQSVLFAQSGGLDRPLHNRDRLLGFLEHFLTGYEREHQLSSAWLNRLDLFIAYRRVLLFIAMYEGVKANPGAHTAWKRMILTEPPLLGAFAP